MAIFRTGHREILHPLHHFSLYFILQNGVFLKTANGYYCFIVVLSNDYETNLHFIFVWSLGLQNRK